jgi:predicted amidohydrolase
VDALKAAAVSWKIRSLKDVDGFFDHMDELLGQCEGAELVVMPELVVLELLTLEPDTSPKEAGPVTFRLLDGCWDRFGQLAAQYGCTLVAGTYLIPAERGWTNSALVIDPSGKATLDVPKVVPTPYEAAEMGVVPGSGLRRLSDQRLGVTVCYDAEFPESGRRLAEAGALVQCVPAFTETRRGFQRVRWCCLARAVENQVFVLHSSLVGALGCEPVPDAVGSSAVIAPSVEPFPERAVLAETPWNEEGTAVATLDFERLARARSAGEVRNWNDRNRTTWPLTATAFLPSPKP